MSDKPTSELPDALIDAHLGLAYDSSGLNGMTGEAWDRIVARRFFALGMATAAGLLEVPASLACNRDPVHIACLMPGWCKAHGKCVHADRAANGVKL